MTNEQIKNFLGLARRCDDLGLHEAAAALDRLVTLREYILPQAGCLEAPGTLAAIPEVPAGHAYFPHLPVASWRLIVKDR